MLELRGNANGTFTTEDFDMGDFCVRTTGVVADEEKRRLSPVFEDKIISGAGMTLPSAGKCQEDLPVGDFRSFPLKGFALLGDTALRNT